MVYGPRFLLASNAKSLFSDLRILNLCSPKWFHNLREPLGYVTPIVWSQRRVDDEFLRNRLFKKNNLNESGAKISFFNNEVEAILSGSPIDNGAKFLESRTIDELECLDSRIYDNLKKMGFNDLTPVQRYAVNILSEDAVVKINDDVERAVGKYDLMGSAQTGSGKTLAYLLPVMNRLLRRYPHEAMQNVLKMSGDCQFPSVLVLVPTRELAQQVWEVSNKLSYGTYLRSVTVFGGESASRQLAELNKGCHLLIATPGRLLDFLRREVINMSHCRSLILDEADRLLEVGFEADLRELLNTPSHNMPSSENRQTLLFSATFPPQVSKLASSYLRGFSCISLNLIDKQLMDSNQTVVPTWGSQVSSDLVDKLGQLTLIIPKQIQQHLQLIEGSFEKDLFKHVQKVICDFQSKYANLGDCCRILVFCNRKSDVDNIDRFLYRTGFKSACIHGDKSQDFRTRAISLFKKGTVNVLVASSVASRGLDVPNIRAVINIGLPTSIDDYVHRVGRTGRMGEAGEAVTIISEDMLDTPVGLNSCAAICKIIKSSMGHLDTVPNTIVEAIGQSKLAKKLDLRSEYGDRNRGDYNGKNRSSRFGGRFDKARNELNERYGYR